MDLRPAPLSPSNTSIDSLSWSDPQAHRPVLGLVSMMLIFLVTVPTLLSLVEKARSAVRTNGYEAVSKLYEDEDGTATEDTQKGYSVALQKFLIFLGSLLGLAASITIAVLATPRNPYVEDWLTFGSWCFLVIQSIYLSIERNPVRLYNFGCLDAVGFGLLIVYICLRAQFSTAEYQWSFTTVVVLVIQFLAAVVCCLACLSIPRRPHLQEGGTAVDAQYTVSAFDSYTFRWAGPTFVLARKKKTLGLDDLPKLHWKIRSASLQNYFNSMKMRDQLWKSLVVAHYPELLFQTVFATLQAAVQFIPSLAMYQLLKLLEQRTSGAPVRKAMWGLVIALGLSIIFSAWLQAWTHWIVWARLGSPIRTELSAMIFTKSTRRKDVKDVQKSRASTRLEVANGIFPALQGSDNQQGIETASIPAPSPAQRKQDEENKEPEEDIQKSRQSTINLVGVDAKRVSDFATFYYLFPQTAATLVVSFWFLVKLIGWRSLLAGLSVFLFALPLNIYVSKAFSDAQSELMEVRDQKMVVVTEALQGIRQIKFSAQEQQWQAKIGRKREEELATQWRVFCLDTSLIGIWILGPVMLSAVSLAVYAILNGGLSASVAFTAITVMSSMELALAILPEVIADALEAWVSVKRIGEYLDAPERDQYISPGNAISFEDASVAWPSDSPDEDPDRFVLKDINVHFPYNELSVISGKTGTGKSLFLASILGEADRLAGHIKVPRAPSSKERFDYIANKTDWIIPAAVAFVAQIPWIENATIKDNILFGLPFDSGRYKKVISCCALEKDLDLLTDGELTDIGANGINLSGGQRWRLSFARALYSRAGILVLDDIFSAVDTHVGRQLFEDALTGEIGTGRTRILVTHHVGLCLSRAKYAVVLADGTVQHAGPVEDLQRDGVIEQVLKQQQESKPNEVYKDDEGLLHSEYIADGGLSRNLSNATTSSRKIDSGELDIQGKLQPKKFVEDEKRETGSMKIGIYKEYLISSGGFWFWGPLMVLYVLYQGLLLGRSWFVGAWTRSYDKGSVLLQQLPHNFYMPPMAVLNADDPNDDLPFYLGVYIGLSVVICIFGTLRYWFVFMGSIRASKKLFDSLTYTVLRAPLRWLDITPVGRTLNRFTADFAAIDSRLGNDIGFLLYHLLELVGIIVAGLFVSPIMLLFALMLLIACAWVTWWYLTGAREVKRLESNAKSPIFEQFGSSLAGIGTIRAFDKTEIYIERMFAKIDTHARAVWFLWLCQRWLALRSNAIGAVFAILVATVIAFYDIEASLAGFALSWGLQYSSAILWSARCYANCELNFNAVERVSEYANLPIEKQDSSTNVRASWPEEGRLQVSGLVAGYAPDLPPVLKGLSLSVEKNQRVGVVGRTGAGKSSLTLALFRFLDAREGSIYIDNVDVSKISLHDLRSRLAIIPQDPVLFSGTVRSNLDPFTKYTDPELYDALQRVHLIRSTGLASRDEASGSNTPTPAAPIAQDPNTNIFTSLSSRISEGGLNLSQGQRQLLCLARAIVSRPKIMVLDEATSAVDMATDVLIQRSIREEFQDSTLIVIAHRLSTIADFDRILVMEDGRAVEFDEPRVLMGRKGVFAGMVEQSGEKERLEEILGGLEEEQASGAP